MMMMMFMKLVRCVINLREGWVLLKKPRGDIDVVGELK